MRSLSRRIVEHGWIELRRRRFPSPLALITSTSTREGTRVPDRDQPRKGAVILDRDRNSIHALPRRIVDDRPIDSRLGR